MVLLIEEERRGRRVSWTNAAGGQASSAIWKRTSAWITKLGWPTGRLASEQQTGPSTVEACALAGPGKTAEKVALARQQREQRLWQRPQQRNHVWSYDFLTVRT